MRRTPDDEVPISVVLDFTITWWRPRRGMWIHNIRVVEFNASRGTLTFYCRDNTYCFESDFATFEAASRCDSFFMETKQ